VKKVRIGYDQTAARFNQVLTNIKADFLNPKKLKFISKFPDDYLKGLELELYQLTDFYALNFQQPLADAQAEELDGGAIFLLLSELIGLSKGLFSYFGQIRQNARQYNEAYLQQHFFKPNRMSAWDEINDGGGAGYQNYDNYAEEPTYTDPTDSDMTYPANDAEFPEINLQSLEQLKNNDQQQEAETYDEWLDTNETDQSDEEWVDDPDFQPGTAPADSTKTIVPTGKKKDTPVKQQAKSKKVKKKKKNG
nr:hypothetical protein [Saprospiraceae bacterium]